MAKKSAEQRREAIASNVMLWFWRGALLGVLRVRRQPSTELEPQT